MRYYFVTLNYGYISNKIILFDLVGAAALRSVGLTERYWRSGCAGRCPECPQGGVGQQAGILFPLRTSEIWSVYL